MAEVIAQAIGSEPQIVYEHEGVDLEDTADGIDGLVWVHELFKPHNNNVRLRPGVVMEGRDEMDDEFLRATLSDKLCDKISHFIKAQELKAKIKEAEALSEENSLAVDPCIEETNASDEPWEPRAEFLNHVKAAYTKCETTVKLDKDGKITLDEGGLYRNDRGQIWIPREMHLIKRLIRTAHDSTLAAHRHTEATVKRLENFDWENKRSDIEKYCNECLRCKMAKGRTGKSWGYLTDLGTPMVPFSHIHIDFTGPLDDHHKLMVVVDRLTTFTVVSLLPITATTTKMAAKLFDEVFSLFGLPSKVTSDNDVLFGSRFWKSLMDRAGVEHITTAVCRPQANGKVERMIRVVKEALRACLTTTREGDDWKSLVKAVQFAVNSTSRPSRDSPAKEVFGWAPRDALSAMTGLSQIGWKDDSR